MPPDTALALEPMTLNLPDPLYRAIPALHYSSIKHGLIDPSLIYWSMNAPPGDPTEALVFGSAFDCYCLENEDFNERYVVRPADQNRKGKKNAEIQDAFTKECQEKGMEIITADQLKLLRDMHRSMTFHPPVNNAVLNLDEHTFTQVTLQAVVRGVQCKIRIDVLRVAPDEQPHITDLKSTKEPNLDTYHIEKAIDTYKYHIQEAFYRIVAAEALGSDPLFDFAFVSKAKPRYMPALYTIGEPVIAAAMEDVYRLIDAFKEYDPDAQQTPIPCGLPNYAL